MQTVLKAFKTTNRRFSVGDKVTEADVENFARWQDRGFISGGAPAAEVKADMPAAAPAETLVEAAREERKKR